MKEIRETKMVEKTTVKYIAKDGSEYDNEHDCLVYEKSLDYNERRAAMDAISVRLECPFARWFYGDECHARLVTISSKMDWVTVLAFYWDYTDNYLLDQPLDKYMENEGLTFPFKMLIGAGVDYVSIMGSSYDKDWNATLLKSLRNDVDVLSQAFES